MSFKKILQELGGCQGCVRFPSHSSRTGKCFRIAFKKIEDEPVLISFAADCFSCSV